jgi:1-acyl-sn-glycerol-3-phosphate acyltransferase
VSPFRLVPQAAEAGARAARAGACIAGSSVAAVAVARRLRRLALETGPFETPHDRALALRDVCRRLVLLHGVEVDSRGIPPVGPHLLVANHVSWLDPVIVGAAVPCAVVSKAEVAAWPVVGGLSRALGALFVARGDVHSGARVLRAAEQALRAGLPVLNFPEGTTTTGRCVLPFHRGLFGIARNLGVPVVPLAISYDPGSLAWVGDATFLPHYLRFAGDGRARVRLRGGPPIAARAHAGPSDLARAARDGVLALLGGAGAAAVRS